MAFAMENEVKPLMIFLQKLRNFKSSFTKAINIAVISFTELHHASSAISFRLCIKQNSFGNTNSVRSIGSSTNALGEIKTNDQKTMHNADYVPSTTNTSGFVDTAIRVNFSPLQLPPEKRKLGEILRELTHNKQFFYGIEVTARSFGSEPVLLDYKSFGAVLPLFTSLVWLGQDYAQVADVAQVESLRVGKQLQPDTIVMPHFSCYRSDHERLAQFLNLNFTNVLALRGDQVDKHQDFKHASELVAAIRRIRADSISIGVAGYPEGHPDSNSLDEDIDFLLQKVNAGADFIITQICFNPRSIIEFIQKCRSHGILVPIVVGVYVPDNMRVLRRMSEITQVKIPAEDLANYEAITGDSKAFHEYAESQAVELIQEVFSSNLDVYGVQFYTMNKFKSVQRVLHRILEKKKI